MKQEIFFFEELSSSQKYAQRGELSLTFTLTMKKENEKRQKEIGRERSERGSKFRCRTQRENISSEADSRESHE